MLLIALLVLFCAMAAALVAPTWFTVASLTARRAFAPIVRGSVETLCVLAAAAISAASALAQVASLSLDADAVWFCLIGPPAFAAAPWVAGELLSGPSQDPLSSLAAAAAIAQPAALLGFAAVGPAAGAICGAACAALVYLRVRGAPTPAR
jgi:hypothetical protein